MWRVLHLFWSVLTILYDIFAWVCCWCFPPFKVYTDFRGFTPDQGKTLKSLLREFHFQIRHSTRKISKNVKKYSIRVKETHTGKGLFCGRDIPHNTMIGVYQSEIVTHAYQEANPGNRSYLFAYGELFIPTDRIHVDEPVVSSALGRTASSFMESVKVLIDALYTVGALWPGNGGLVNHRCYDPNCSYKWIEEPKTGIWYLITLTKRKIIKGEQLTVSYNAPKGVGEQYIRTRHSMRDVPAEFVTLCGCRYPKPCIYRKSFDSRDFLRN